MKKTKLFITIIVLMLGTGMSQVEAQDRTVYFDVNANGVSKPITWGLDLAWLSEGNIRRGIGFMGANQIDVVRSSFIPTDPVVNGQLTGNSLTNTNLRLDIIDNWLSPSVKVVLNCDHPSVHSWYAGNAANWAELIDVTTSMHENIGRTVITVSPFNEPDYTVTGQGTMQDFYNICGELRNKPHFNNIRISGGNTLNTDEALNWYNYLQSRLDEGNTHQLAGSFNNYANFFQTVRANGDHASNDELHNVMEAMVGVEYGMQTGIWWGTAEYARGEFVKASDGVRLGYAEHRTNWTAASVYRAPDGKVQAFIGGSERQAATTTYRFVSQNEAVFFDGYGPYYEYTITYPGGAVGSYQNGQTNAEKVINITWGEDIQPVIDGTYKIVNRNSGKVLEVAGQSTADGANVQQGTYSGNSSQHWNVNPVDSRIGGDWSYFSITSAQSGKSLDVDNWSLNNGGNIFMWATALGSNQQWYLEYAEDGWFYIRSRHSAKALDVYNNSTADGANVDQWDKAGINQQWRFLPVGAPIEFNTPNAPTSLSGNGNPSSISLNWNASSSPDVAGYTVFRTAEGEAYNTIARNVTSTSYTDNDVSSGVQYYYKIKAVDGSLNYSAYSNETGPLTTGSSGSSSSSGGIFNGTYSFVAQHSGKALDTYNWGTGNGTNIVQWAYWGGNTQRYNVTHISDGYHRISPVISTGQAFDIDSWSTANGANLMTWSWAGGTNQRYRFEGEVGGVYRIIPEHSQKCIDIEGGSTADGANAFQWTCISGAQNQMFEVVSNSSAYAKENTKTFAMYPNPATSHFNLNLQYLTEEGADLSIYNSIGVRVLSCLISQNDQEVGIIGLEPGLYFVKVKQGDITHTEILYKQ